MTSTALLAGNEMQGENLQIALNLRGAGKERFRNQNTLLDYTFVTKTNIYLHLKDWEAIYRTFLCEQTSVPLEFCSDYMFIFQRKK